MGKPRTTRAVLEYRTKRVYGLIKPFGGEVSGASYLIRHRKMRVEEIARRVELLEKLNLKPGIIRVLGYTNKEFSEFIARKTGFGRDSLQPAQREAYELLISKGVGLENSLKIAFRRGMNRFSCEKRFALLEQDLSPSRYGLKKIPKEVIPLLMHLKPFVLNEVIKSHVLLVMENYNAKRILNTVFPSWRKMSVVYGKIEPRTVLAKFELIVKKRKVPTMGVLREYSVKEIPQRVKGLELLNPNLRKWMIEKMSELKRTPLTKTEEKELIEKIKKEFIRKK
ncbi:MAG: hypothetical protein PHY04_04090 [Candidatus ainarchaeum sp.]|jgi:hypothetical protein|nr:hypothetical protein [Candidatus ainarchaeum sp.]MDD3086243.1 hypothetical protein [Candidatus ainarchaeum sp.]MDD4128889.1 hypothetical protein [Candidatus ainarchaeum sp.]MDD4468076.1 hypothetical protein [Candidatus ainarchaeum sp.]